MLCFARSLSSFFALSCWDGGKLGWARLELGGGGMMGNTHHPIYRFRVKMAAMGSVDDSVDENSELSPALVAGSWYGTTGFLC